MVTEEQVYVCCVAHPELIRSHLCLLAPEEWYGGYICCDHRFHFALQDAWQQKDRRTVTLTSTQRKQFSKSSELSSGYQVKTT